MKKVFSVVLALMLALTLSVSAFAAGSASKPVEVVPDQTVVKPEGSTTAKEQNAEVVDQILAENSGATVIVQEGKTEDDIKEAAKEEGTTVTLEAEVKPAEKPVVSPEAKAEVANKVGAANGTKATTAVVSIDVTLKVTKGEEVVAEAEVKGKLPEIVVEIPVVTADTWAAVFHMEVDGSVTHVGNFPIVGGAIQANLSQFSDYLIATYTPAPVSTGTVEVDDTIYVNCPSCGHHHWTASAEGYTCDNCGFKTDYVRPDAAGVTGNVALAQDHYNRVTAGLAASATTGRTSPKTGDVTLVCAGVAALACGVGVVAFRKKED